MVSGYDRGWDPTLTVTLYYILQWLVKAWDYDVKSTTIYKCFRKSTIITPQMEHLSAPSPPDLTALYTQVQ